MLVNRLNNCGLVKHMKSQFLYLNKMLKLIKALGSHFKMLIVKVVRWQHQEKIKEE